MERKRRRGWEGKGIGGEVDTNAKLEQGRPLAKDNDGPVFTAANNSLTLIEVISPACTEHTEMS